MAVLNGDTLESLLWVEGYDVRHVLSGDDLPSFFEVGVGSCLFHIGETWFEGDTWFVDGASISIVIYEDREWLDTLLPDPLDESGLIRLITTLG